MSPEKKRAMIKRDHPERSISQQCKLVNLSRSAWITTLTEAGVRISMNGRGCYLDNIFIERLWRSLKQEAIYLEDIDNGFEARRVVKNWKAFYNTKRPRSALDRRTPDNAYWAGLEEQKAA